MEVEGGRPLPTVSFARRGAYFLFTPGSSIVGFFISPASHFDLFDKNDRPGEDGTLRSV